MVCRDQVLLADFTKKGVNGAYALHTFNKTHTSMKKLFLNNFFIKPIFRNNESEFIVK